VTICAPCAGSLRCTTKCES